MKAKIIFSAGALCFFLTIPAWAQTQTQTTPSTPSTPAKPVVDTESIVSNIQSQLKLTLAQAKKITPIIEEENQKLSRILTPDQMNQWMNALNQIHQKHKKSKHSSATSTSSGPKT